MANFNDEQLQKITDEDAKIPTVIHRMRAYGIGEQLNALYDDIQAGLFGEAAKTGQFCAYVESVKQAYPKS
jgi:hypothetical protein